MAHEYIRAFAYGAGDDAPDAPAAAFAEPEGRRSPGEAGPARAADPLDRERIDATLASRFAELRHRHHAASIEALFRPAAAAAAGLPGGGGEEDPEAAAAAAAARRAAQRRRRNVALLREVFPGLEHAPILLMRWLK